MKTFKKIINCLETYIKKNFFNLSEADINQDCEKVLKLNFIEEKDNVMVEEYTSSYKSTTRWQTL